MGSAAPFSRIESVGIALPVRRRTSEEIGAGLTHRFRMDLYRMTGIREARRCSEGEDAVSLAAGAARDCLSHSEGGPEDLDLVISCSISRYRSDLSFQFEPPLSFEVARAIGAHRAMTFDVTNACAGMMTGVMVLDSFIRRGKVRRGMVVSGEFISSLTDNALREARGLMHPQVASLTLGDAGAAVILERAPDGRPGIEACAFTTYPRYADLCVGRSCDSGPGGAMFTDSLRLHDKAIGCCIPTIARALEVAGVRGRDVHHTIPHQTAVGAIRKGTDHVVGKLGPSDSKVVYNLENVGNTASTSHFLALHRQLQLGTIKAGERVLMLVYASGLVIGALVFRMDELASRDYGRGH